MALFALGSLPERNKQCSFTTYFKPVLLPAGASGHKETSFIKVGAGGAES